MKNEALNTTISFLDNLGWSQRRLAIELKISRARIKRILTNKNNNQESDSGNIKMRKRPSKLDPYKRIIDSLLD